jgi:sugar lactone lactonase YvrE
MLTYSVCFPAGKMANLALSILVIRNLGHIDASHIGFTQAKKHRQEARSKLMKLRYSIILLVAITALIASACVMTLEQAAQTADQGSDVQVETIKVFEESPSHLPEGIAIDKDANLYVSLGPPFFVGGGYGAVRKIGPDGTEKTLVEFPNGPAPAGLAIDASGDVYFALPNPGQPDVGVYRITGDNGAERLPGTEGMLVPNGLAFDNQGNLYASDSIHGSIWQMPHDGIAAESWFAHDWLAGCGEDDAIGANGVVYSDGELYVANTAKGMLVRIPILSDGTAGEPTISAGNPDCNPDDELYGMDGIALDASGNVYALLVLPHKLVRIDPADGTTTPLLSEEDGLWNPASIVFGTQESDADSIFITNYAVLPPEPTNNLGPALLKYDVGR